MKDIWRKPAQMTDEQWATRKAEMESAHVDNSWSVRWSVLIFLIVAMVVAKLAYPHLKEFFRWTDSLIGSLLGL